MTADRPGRVADRIAGLRELDGVRLEPRPDRDLRDVYLDRPGEPLGEAGLVLRIRRSAEGRPLLGVKGDERRLPGGGVDRLEREGPWGRDALAAAGGALDRAGLSPSLLPDEPGRGSPVERLRSHGWRVVQDRRTRRRARILRRAGEPGTLGELTVDEVRFAPDGGPAIHREVEIEASPGRALPSDVVGSLLRRFGGELRRWDRSKLATGRALERLFAEGGPDRWRAPDGSLVPAAYDRIERLLEED